MNFRFAGYSDEAVEYTKKANIPENNVVTEYTRTDNMMTDVIHVGGKEVFRNQFQIGKEREFTDKTNRISKVR